MSDKNEILRENIKKLRKLHNFTLKEVGEHVGVSEATIQRYENGVVRVIPADKIILLAEKFGITPAELAGWNTKAGETAAALEKDLPAKIHIEKYLQLTPDNRAVVDTVTDALLTQQP